MPVLLCTDMMNVVRYWNEKEALCSLVDGWQEDRYPKPMWHDTNMYILLCYDVSFLTNPIHTFPPMAWDFWSIISWIYSNIRVLSTGWDHKCYAGVSVEPTPPPTMEKGGRYRVGVHDILHSRGGSFCEVMETPKWHFLKSLHVHIHDGGHYQWGVQLNYAPGGGTCRIWRPKFQSPPISWQWGRWGLHWPLHYQLHGVLASVTGMPTQITGAAI